jgi:hypothetical protein
MGGSPEVKALGGREFVFLFGSAQRASNQEGRSESERIRRRNLVPRVKLICGTVGEAKWFPPFHDGQCRGGSTGISTSRISRRKLKAAILESTAVKVRKVWWPGRNAKDRPYNRHCREVGRRRPDRRMGSASEEGWDNITQHERGPQGPGEFAKAPVPYFDAGVPLGRCGLEGGSKLFHYFETGRLHAELIGAWCLKPYWGKPNVRNFREGGWKREPWPN